MLERIRLEASALRARARGDIRVSQATLAKGQFLKVEGDAVGQEFGMRVCTSNGPLRSTGGAVNGHGLST